MDGLLSCATLFSLLLLRGIGRKHDEEKKKSPQKLMGWNKEQLNNNNDSKVKAMLKQEERNYSLPPISK